MNRRQFLKTGSLGITSALIPASVFCAVGQEAVDVPKRFTLAHCNICGKTTMFTSNDDMEVFRSAEAFLTRHREGCGRYGDFREEALCFAERECCDVDVSYTRNINTAEPIKACPVCDKDLFFSEVAKLNEHKSQWDFSYYNFRGAV
jgi:hypothetical protein